ncbi:MAG: hypothetical protein ACI8P0_001987, partial [Planctomycetaceae bacterium]
QSLRVIPGTVCHDSVRGGFVRKLTDRVEGSAKLERSDFLKVLTFKEEPPSRELVNRRAGHHRRAMRNSGNRRRSSLHILESHF